MALGEKLARRAFLPPLPDPYRSETPGYSQPDAIDSTGFSLADRGERGDGEISDVSPPRLSPVVGRLTDASYGDGTVHPVPGGALGEAGAAWRPEDARGLMVPGVTQQHAIKPAPLDYTGGLRPLVSPDMDGGRDERSAPNGAQRSAPMSDSEVYRDVYGARMPERRQDPGAS